MARPRSDDPFETIKIRRSTLMLLRKEGVETYKKHTPECRDHEITTDKIIFRALKFWIRDPLEEMFNAKR